MAKGMDSATKKVLASIREATGAGDDEIAFVLDQCGGDPNEAIVKLLESRWRPTVLASTHKCPLTDLSFHADPFVRVPTKAEKKRAVRVAAWLG